jgi:hypothetical protein
MKSFKQFSESGAGEWGTKELVDKYKKDTPNESAKYHKGLSKSTEKKREAQFKKQAKMDDDDPNAYKPAPGDARAKTKPSKYTKKYHQMYGESVELEEDVKAGLTKKADKSGISYSILKKVYDRGVAAWKSGHRPGTTPSQWGYARVNSFITGGKTRTTADADLWKKHKGIKEEVAANSVAGGGVDMNPTGVPYKKRDKRKRDDTDTMYRRNLGLNIIKKIMKEKQRDK